MTGSNRLHVLSVLLGVLVGRGKAERKHFIRIGAGLICTLVLSLAVAVSPHLFPSRQPSGSPVAPINGSIHIGMAGWVSNHRPEEAIPFADLVVLAEITGIGEARWNTVDGLRTDGWQHNAGSLPRAMIYTPFGFRVIEVFKGDATSELASEFAAVGGQVGDDVVDADQLLSLHWDLRARDRAILFLRRAAGDMAYAAPYTYVDALRVDKGKATADCKGSRAVTDCRTVFELSDVLTRIRAASEAAE